MTKAEKRTARRNLNKLYILLTGREKKLYRKDRIVKSTDVSKARIGLKQWILNNKPIYLDTMYKLGLLKKTNEKKS